MTDAMCVATFQDFLLSGELNSNASQYQIKIKVLNTPEPQTISDSKRKTSKIEKPIKEVDKYYYTNQDRFFVYIP